MYCFEHFCFFLQIYQKYVKIWDIRSTDISSEDWAQEVNNYTRSPNVLLWACLLDAKQASLSHWKHSGNKSWMCYWSRLKPRLEVKQYVIEKQPKSLFRFLPVTKLNSDIRWDVLLNIYVLRRQIKGSPKISLGWGQAWIYKVVCRRGELKVAGFCFPICTVGPVGSPVCTQQCADTYLPQLDWGCVYGGIYAVLHLKEPIHTHNDMIHVRLQEKAPCRTGPAGVIHISSNWRPLAWEEKETLFPRTLFLKRVFYDSWRARKEQEQLLFTLKIAVPFMC